MLKIKIKMNKRKNIVLAKLMLVALTLLGATFASAQVFAQTSYESLGNIQAGVKASAQDTIAGYETTVRSSPVVPGDDVYFRVDKADGTNFEAHYAASYDGTAAFKIDGFHTRKAGTYQVCAKLGEYSQYGTCSSFKVLTGSLSTSVSKVSPENQVVKIPLEKGKVRVQLTDLYGNAVSGHVVNLISDRTGDEASSTMNVSDNNGFVNFETSSASSGVSTYTAYDLTSNKALTTKAKIVYFDSASYLFEAKAVGNSSGAVAYLGFSEVPAKPIVGQSVSFTLQAYDSSGQPVTGYSGTVGFSVMEGSQTAVTLPSSYTFIPIDLGIHTFSLGATFSAAGKYVLKAEDLSTPAVFGTVELNVAAGSIATAQKVELTNPTAGSYSNNIQIISGKTLAGATLILNDNGEKIGTATSSASGDFVFTTGILADGKHDMTATILDDKGVVQASSDVVSVIIDTTKPELTSFEVVPSNPGAGSDVKVKVVSEAGLSLVAVKIADLTYNLAEEAAAGTYSASLKAPLLASDYPVSISLTDTLGNQTIVEGKYTMKVGEGTGSGPIGDVTSLIVYPAAHQVYLAWKAPVSGAAVKFYRIYYGISADQLNFAVDTWGASTKWYISNLKNSTEYFFAVVAVDNNGNVSTKMSNIVSAIPGTIVDIPPDVLDGTAGKEDIENLPSDKSETGPEVAWLIAAAIFGGLCYNVAQKKENW